MICPSCDRRNPDDAERCSHCGYDFRSAVAVDEPPRNFQDTDTGGKRNLRATVLSWPVAAGAASAIALGLLIYLFLSRSQPNPPLPPVTVTTTGGPQHPPSFYGVGILG